MTLKEAADRLGVAPSTLRVQIRNGKLRARKVGRDWWITPAEVDRYGREHGRQVGRCTARHPDLKHIRCADEADHAGPHYHQFRAYSWDDRPEPELPNLIGQTNVKSTAYRWARQYRKAGRPVQLIRSDDGFYTLRSDY